MTNEPAITISGSPVSRRAVVKCGARLAYSAPLVTATFGLTSLHADAKKKKDLVSGDAGEIVDPENVAPIAEAGEGFEVEDQDGDGFETVTVDGSSSADPDGKITSYLWTLGNEQVASDAVATVTLPVGTHRLTLTVTDDKGETASARIRIKVNRGPRQDAVADEAPAEEELAAQPALPAAPYNIEVRQKKAEIAVTWKATPDTPLPHRVYRAIDDGLDRSTDELLDELFWELLREEWELRLSYRDATAQVGVPYLYAVRSFDGVNESERSNVARIMPEPYQEEPLPTEAPPEPTATVPPPEPTAVPDTPTPIPVEVTPTPEPPAEVVEDAVDEATDS